MLIGRIAAVAAVLLLAGCASAPFVAYQGAPRPDAETALITGAGTGISFMTIDGQQVGSVTRAAGGITGITGPTATLVLPGEHVLGVSYQTPNAYGQTTTVRITAVAGRQYKLAPRTGPTGWSVVVTEAAR